MPNTHYRYFFMTCNVEGLLPVIKRSACFVYIIAKYRDFVSHSISPDRTTRALSVVGPSLLQLQRPGNSYRTVSMTQRSAATALVVTTQHIQCSRDAS